MQTKTIGHLLRQSAFRYPDREAVVYGNERLSYRQLDRLVDAFSVGLERRNIEPGSHVAVIATNSLKQVVTHLALNRVGAVGILFNPQLSGAELVPLFERTEPVLVVADSDQVGKLESLRAQLPSLEFASIAIGAEGEDDWSGCLVEDGSVPKDPLLAGDAPSVMMFTSGTTGVPKAAILEREAEWLNTVLMIAELRLCAADRNLNIAPLFHAAPWGCHFLPHMAVGACNIIIGRFNGAELPVLLQEEDVTTLLGVPTHFELAINSAGEYPDEMSLRLVSVTGAPVRKETLQWISENLTSNIFNIYGLTEATTLITICPPEEIWRTQDAVCIGRPLLSMETALRPLDEPRTANWLERQDEISEGELVCRGPKLMTGYYRQPDQTAERIEDGWMYTGDVCRRDEEGYLYLSAREDDLIVTAGEKVYPSEIEALINSCAAVEDSVAIGIDDGVWGNVIAAFVVPVDAKATQEQIMKEIEESWDAASYKRPRLVRTIPSIPRNPSGKILRKNLRELL